MKKGTKNLSDEVRKLDFGRRHSEAAVPGKGDAFSFRPLPNFTPPLEIRKEGKMQRQSREGMSRTTPPLSRSPSLWTSDAPPPPMDGLIVTRARRCAAILQKKNKREHPTDAFSFAFFRHAHLFQLSQYLN